MHERLQPSRKALRYVAEKLTQFVQHSLKPFERLVRIDVAHCWQSGGHLGPIKVRVCEALACVDLGAFAYFVTKVWRPLGRFHVVEPALVPDPSQPFELLELSQGSGPLVGQALHLSEVVRP